MIAHNEEASSVIESREENANVARAYDRVATEYDTQLLSDSWMRAALWSCFDRLFSAGQNVLDCGCGTGIDAVHLAQKGVKVTAIDVSEGMVSATRARAAESKVDVQSMTLDIRDIIQLPRGSFHGVISCFAALNTQAHLGHFSQNAADLLKPDGMLVIHILNPWSLWEFLTLLCRGRWHVAKDLGKEPKRDFVIGGVTLHHSLWHPAKLYDQSFREHFVVRRRYGLGLLRPPGSNIHVAPFVLAVVTLMDRALGRLYLVRNWGRFSVLELQRRPSL